MSTLSDRLRGLAAIVLILLLIVGTPVLLTAIAANPLAVTSPLRDLPQLLTQPDDGTLALALIGVVCWIAWAAMTTMVLLEILATLRGVSTPRLPGLRLPQQATRQLVATAVLLFIATPVITRAGIMQRAEASAPTPAGSVATSTARSGDVTLVSPTQTAGISGNKEAAPPTDREPRVESPVTHEVYVTRWGDSLWKIAQEHLGAGAQYTEIVALNEDVLHGRPDFIDPGLVLRLPSDASRGESDEAESQAAETHLVEPGDTLWAVADDELGEGDRYPEIFEASRDVVQPDGRHLSDPDLIRPGWELTIPDIALGNSPVENQPTNNDPSVATEVSPAVPPDQTGTDKTPPTSTPPNEARGESQSAAAPTAGASQSPADALAAEDDEDASASWLVPGFMGAGALLAGAVLVTVRAHRRTQQRYRRPGFTITPPPPKLHSVEKTASAAGTPTVAVIGQLDRLLRHVAAHSPVLPAIEAVEVDTHVVTLHLADPADLPAPWAGAERTFTANLDSPVEDEDQLSPYPLLASVGQSADGHLWLIDLERLGTVSLAGDAEHARALARHLAAELALSPWAVIAEVETIDIAPELAALDPLRLRQHQTDDADFLDRLHRELNRAQQAGHGDPEPFRVLIVAEAAVEQVLALADLVRHQQSRSGFALVRVLAPAESGDVVIDLAADGRLRIADLGLDLTAAGLSAAEAEACAAIVDLTRDATLTPMPREAGASGWRALADRTGALVADLTERRPAGEAGNRSLLPETPQRYETVAPTTADDIEALAPVVPAATRHTVEESDPELDADLDEWHNADSRLPRLRLLGPVTVTVKGAVVPKVIERKAYFIELITFLALHPSGVSSRQVREAFGMSQSRARTDIGFIRTWFGVSARTGTPHLPAATTSPAHADRGTNGYQLNDVLVDLDLFRRLRARAQARGAEGISDLVGALQLVTGEPFSSLREPGWSWLLDEERIHETTVFAVVDVAHIVATDALARGDLARARFAAETGCRAAPYDEVCRLDLAKVVEAEGHGELADQILSEHVFNRTDDHLPPIDLPDRTAKVVKNHGWGHPKHRPTD